MSDIQALGDRAAAYYGELQDLREAIADRYGAGITARVLNGLLSFAGWALRRIEAKQS